VALRAAAQRSNAEPVRELWINLAALYPQSLGRRGGSQTNSKKKKNKKKKKKKKKKKRGKKKKKKHPASPRRSRRCLAPAVFGLTPTSKMVYSSRAPQQIPELFWLAGALGAARAFKAPFSSELVALGSALT
jgi:hypothetical protein